MADLNTNSGLLVGSEQHSKSHPGTQVTPKVDTQGPGCPSYSGGGKDPRNLNLQKPTPASPLDLTSLATAISEPVPVPASTWTLVAPKKKRDKNKKKDTKQTDRPTSMNRDHRRTDDNNDKRTDKVGIKGGKREDPDRSTASVGGVTRVSEGGNEGNATHVDAATPGSSANERGNERESVSDRDPKALGESGITTTEAGQTDVKERGNDGGHKDPKVNPNRAQGATGPGGSNTTRPPTTTNININQPPNSTTNPPPRSGPRAKPRLRNRNKGGAKNNQPPQGNATTSSGLPNKKRDRLDDTISPRREHKRARTEQRQARGATDSYARAAQSHLCVAITTAPRFDLTQAEADAIQGLIQKSIFAACIEPLAPGQTRYAPAFEGKAFLSDGVLKMWCHDDRALSWLTNLMTTIKSPRSGTDLTVIRQSDIPEKVRSGLFVPNYDGEIGLLHQVLSHQNPWYNVSQWTLFSYQPTTSNPPGMFLIMGIPKGELDTILARGRKIAYSTGSIYVRFFTSGGLSDVPPGHGSVPTDGEQPGEGGDMETDETANPRAEIPEPSVSTVLHNIEEMLAEPRATQNIAETNTAPTEQPTVRKAPQQ